MDIDELIENFSFFENWEEKYQYVIDLGRTLEPLEETVRTETWKVQGCRSQVWLVPRIDDGCIHVEGGGGAVLVKGIIAIVLSVYNDKSPQEIKNIDIKEIYAKLGLEENLTPSRRNGMMSMVAKIREYAENC